MAENALVAIAASPQFLTHDRVQLGATFLTALDGAALNVKAALWLMDPETHRWKFLIASPLVATQGPRKTYSKVRKILQKLNQSDFTLQDIVAVPPSYPLLQLLSIAVRMGPGSGGGIRFTDNTINGVHIEDAYIYRLR